MTINIYDVHNCYLIKDAFGAGGNFTRATYEMVQASNDVHIFVSDGAGSRKRRQAIYPGYKAKRPPMAEDKRAGIDLFKGILAMSRAVSITCPGWEADDVIAQVAREAAANDNVIIHSNDSDFGQLLGVAGISLPRIEVPEFPAEFVPTFKALCGDNTDEVPGLAGFGPGAWNDMRAHWETIKRAFVTGDEALFVSRPWPKRCVAKLDFALLRKFFEVVNFMPVATSEIEAGTVLGSDERAVVEILFRKYIL